MIDGLLGNNSSGKATCRGSRHDTQFVKLRDQNSFEMKHVSAIHLCHDENEGV